MKKLLLFVAIVAGSLTVNAQSFNVGANVGLPTGDASDIASVTFGIEANYLFEVSDKFKVGPTASYVHFLGKSIDVPGVGSIDGESSSYLPLGGAARFSVSDEFVLGADLGLALGMSNASGSTFYYRPMVGYNVSEKMMLQASYMGMSVDVAVPVPGGVAVGSGTIATFSVGVMFAL